MKRTSLVPMNGDPNSARGGVTAAVYRSILEEYLPTILDADSIFVTALVGTVRAVGIYGQEIGATGGERRQDGP